MRKRVRVLILLYWLRFGPPVQARVQAALAESDSDDWSPNTLEALTELRLLVRLTARFVPGSRCLDQALATWILARQQGLPARLRLGIRRLSGRATAHAWISAGDQAIGEDPEALRQLLPLQAGAVSDLREFD